MAKGSSGFDKGGGGKSEENVNISDFAARIMFNAAKKDTNKGEAPKKIKTYENGLSSQEKFLKSLKTEKDVNNAIYYFKQRASNLNKKIAKLGSAQNLQKNPKLYLEQKKVREMINGLQDRRNQVVKYVKDQEPKTQHSIETTTYQRARRRRIKNYEDWFWGGR